MPGATVEPIGLDRGLRTAYLHDVLRPSGTTALGEDSGRGLRGIWLTADGLRSPIEEWVRDMLSAVQPKADTRDACLTALAQGSLPGDTALWELGVKVVGTDSAGPVPLRVVASRWERDPWHDALVLGNQDCPIGLLFTAADEGQIALVHELFTHFAEGSRDVVRRYAGLAAGDHSHDDIVAAFRADEDDPERIRQAFAQAWRQVQARHPSVLFSADGEIRVQLGSVSQTTKTLMREGLYGEHLFILPAALFESQTNYADIEFLVYLNFFIRARRRTRIAGTERQRQILRRLLTVTLFGIFDPTAPRETVFADVRDAYGVPDEETFRFLRVAHELYATRRSDGDGGMLGIDEYLDFTVLRVGETDVRMAAGVVSMRPDADGVDVRIALADGRGAVKRLSVTPPHRLGRLIPEELRRPLQFATDRPRYGVTPLGTSHGFDPTGEFTCFVIWINGKGILVDPSLEALAYLEQIGVADPDVPYVFLTHVHADHDGGLIQKLLSGSRTTIIASGPVFESFAEKAELITGHDFEAEGLVHHITANPGVPVDIDIGGERAQLESRWNLHPIPTNGFKLSFGGQTFGYSGDTQYDPELLDALRESGKIDARQHEALRYFFWTADGAPTVDLLYHEAGIPPIHTPKEQLTTLGDAVKTRVALVHIADKDVPGGFSPAKPPLFRTDVLQPPTSHTRTRALLETLGQVGYLYDIPSATLEQLVEGAEVLECARDETVIRKGYVTPHEPLHFFVILDGEVLVHDDIRDPVRLSKAQSFGEWGISYERGFRAASVTAARPCQLMRFREAQYWWLVEKHPVIQERIGKIRSCLPRLELAKERARLKAGVRLARRRTLLEKMTASQLATFAIFSEVVRFTEGHAIMAEGDPADGFYVLMSGDLNVTVEGQLINELSEGDVFGELGLLRGGRREATVTVASAGAEALFMSSASFRRLLETVPAFAWDVWETAATRRRRAGPERPPR